MERPAYYILILNVHLQYIYNFYLKFNLISVNITEILEYKLITLST